jgi:hypothetical protein
LSCARKKTAWNNTLAWSEFIPNGAEYAKTPALISLLLLVLEQARPAGFRSALGLDRVQAVAKTAHRIPGINPTS